MDVLFVTWQSHTFARDMLAGVMQWHRNRGDSPRFSNFQVKDRTAHYRNPDLTYIWNGQYPYPWYKNVMAHLKKVSGRVKYVEIAWLPQGKFVYFDNKGTNAASSLFTDNLSWIEQKHIDTIATQRATYYDNRQWEGNPSAPVLVPLQLNWDTQITEFGNGWHNQRLIDYASGKFERVVVRPHPKDKNARSYKLPPNAKWQEYGTSLLDAICESGQVFGINSTVLLESALLGAPTTALGQSFINHPAGIERVLAALIAKQVPSTVTDLDAWHSLGLDV